MTKVANYERVSDGFGYVLVFVIPTEEKIALSRSLFDLRNLYGFERPRRQHGWLMYDRTPILPDPNSYVAYVLVIDRESFRSDSLNQQVLFPAPEDDPGYAALLAAPYVQIPSLMLKDWSPSADSDTSSRDERRGITFATRLVGVTEYGLASPVDHKWDDRTIYEPHHMQLWYRWEFDIGTVYSGISGNINKTTKVTIAPWVRKILSRRARYTRPSWLDLGNDGIFFTFAVLDHDKVIEHGPPYEGVWLQRQDDLIVESPMSADFDALSVHGGHVYLMHKEGIQRQQVANSCRCGRPESHDKRVRHLVAIPDLLDKGVVSLVPHPLFDRWYFLW